MGTTVARGFCPACKDFRKVERQDPKFWLHLLIAVLTLGIWAPVLIWVWIMNTGRSGKWICMDCGAKSIHEANKSDIKLEQRFDEVRTGKDTPTWWESRGSAEMNRLYRQEKKRKKQEKKEAKKAAKETK